MRSKSTRGRARRALSTLVAFGAVLLTPAVAAAEDGDVGAGVDGGDGVGVSCTQETWTWTGSAAVTAAGDVIATGVSVPAQLGTTLVVVGAAADGLDATQHAVALPVTVGGVLASAGAAVDTGGEIVVHGPADGSTVGPLTVTGATVVVNRCAEVASAPPAPTSPPSPTIVIVTDPVILPTTAPAAAQPESTGSNALPSNALPSTGSRAVVEISMLAVAILSIGLALRWMATAGGRGPGSRRGELPRAPR